MLRSTQNTRAKFAVKPNLAANQRFLASAGKNKCRKQIGLKRSPFYRRPRQTIFLIVKTYIDEYQHKILPFSRSCFVHPSSSSVTNKTAQQHNSNSHVPCHSAHNSTSHRDSGRGTSHSFSNSRRCQTRPAHQDRKPIRKMDGPNLRPTSSIMAPTSPSSRSSYP